MMTDEERRMDLLSRLHGFGSRRNPRNIPICKEAAEEIERLAAQLKLVEETMRGLQIAFERGHNYD